MKKMGSNEITLNTLFEKLDKIEQMKRIEIKDILRGAKEAALYTGYSESHIYSLTCKNQIPHYKKENDTFFSKSELSEWLTECKVKTDKEIEKAATHLIFTNETRKRRSNRANIIKNR